MLKKRCLEIKNSFNEFCYEQIKNIKFYLFLDKLIISCYNIFEIKERNKNKKVKYKGEYYEQSFIIYTAKI